MYADSVDEIPGEVLLALAVIERQWENFWRGHERQSIDARQWLTAPDSELRSWWLGYFPDFVAKKIDKYVVWRVEQTIPQWAQAGPQNV